STKAGEESGAQAAGAARSASRRNISPRAARLAQELGLDVSLLTGTGPEGRVVEADVERARAARAERPEPPSRMRRIIAERLTESYRTAPHFFTTQSVDMTELEALRAELKGAGLKYSLNDFILKAVALALIEHPPVNGAAGKSSAGHVHLGMAVALEDGLVAPVIREAERLTLDQVHSAAEELAAKARAGKLTPDEMSGSTFTVSNLGMLDVENFTAIINPGESAILAISSVRQQPAVFGGQIAIRRLMKITLSADHRSIDGAVAAGFINSVRAKLQDGELWRSAAGR
ncbi:MAG: 2-oxo acid dehydrogenase subunit E2, partial [Acidobacteria bacterium]|nr:2-oxo acid dehydrogenase subunit E2 [Acidobacteriota bacterium]